MTRSHKAITQEKKVYQKDVKIVIYKHNHISETPLKITIKIIRKNKAISKVAGCKIDKLKSIVWDGNLEHKKDIK